MAKVLEGHTLGRILPPIIDDLDKYQFANLGSSLRSLGVPVSLRLTTVVWAVACVRRDPETIFKGLKD